MLQRFRKVSPTLYRSSAPTPEDVIWLNKQLGITRIISLDKPSYKKIELSCRLLKIKHIDLSIDMSKSSLIRFLSEIGKLFEDEEKTLIHCKWGRDRTGLAVAMYRCQENGWPANKAIEEAKSLDFGTGLDPEVVALYTSFIHDSQDENDVNSASDIVDGSRQSYDDYFGAPSENLSWSPYSDRNVKEFPQTSTSLNDGESNPLSSFGPSVVGGGSTTL